MPDHWFHVILIVQSVSCLLLSKNHVFIIVSTSEGFSMPSKSLNLNQFKNHVKSFDCLSSGVPNYLTHVGYNIPFMQIAICFVLVCVYCSDFLLISYFPCTLYVCQNLYRTSAFGLVNQKSIKLFD